MKIEDLEKLAVELNSKFEDEYRREVANSLIMLHDFRRWLEAGVTQQVSLSHIYVSWDKRPETLEAAIHRALHGSMDKFLLLDYLDFSGLEYDLDKIELNGSNVDVTIKFPIKAIDKLMSVHDQCGVYQYSGTTDLRCLLAELMNIYSFRP